MDISKITSCNTNARRKTSQCKAPTILHNTDLFAFYQMLHDIKKELMCKFVLDWRSNERSISGNHCLETRLTRSLSAMNAGGPSSGMSAIASSGFSQSNGSINNICNSSMSNTSLNASLFGNGGSNFGGSNYSMQSNNFYNHHNGNALNSLSKFGNPSTRDSTNTLSALSYQSYQSNTNGSNHLSSVNSSINGSINSSAISSTNGSTSGSTNHHHNSKYSVKDREIKHHSRQPSDDSSVSLGSAESTLDIDSESEVDSVLADRDSSNSQTSDEHTLHLAAAFKHHLQGLHQILDTLTNTADFFCARYQEEVDQLSEH